MKIFLRRPVEETKVEEVIKEILKEETEEIVEQKIEDEHINIESTEELDILDKELLIQVQQKIIQPIIEKPVSKKKTKTKN